MRILLVATSFNGLTQRVFTELVERGHDVSVELDVNDAALTEATRLFDPDVVLATFLRRRLPEAVWRRYRTLIVHPGPVGDRGPSSLDRAILEGRDQWGVTLLEAAVEMDAGEVWATRAFRMRRAAKSSLYRDEVSEGALAAILEAFDRIASGATAAPTPPTTCSALDLGWRPAVTLDERAIDWSRDPTETVLRKLHAASGQPGVPDTLVGVRCRLHDPHAEALLRGEPGALIARRHGALCRATADGAVWIESVSLDPDSGSRRFKVPAVLALADRVATIAEVPVDLAQQIDGATFREIVYREQGAVGFLDFDFLNGAMSVGQCLRLRKAFAHARARPTRVIVLAGGREFWSNGIHLGVIEHAASPADESLANIDAIDDLALDILTTTDKLVIAALQGNAGAGGAFLALAADRVLVRDGVVLNPHYKNMGNLYGSEYWTYVLPRRTGPEAAETVMGLRLPVGARQALRLGLVDAILPNDRAAFRAAVADEASRLACDPGLAHLLKEKAARRMADEAARPLAAYRTAELERMRRAFYGFDPSYHVARWRFITHEPIARTPFHLARHRRR